ncbi:MAG: hypothetical protein IT424_15345 [Pirellulales bacterium]|jgi:hypothetical protein|nr:hypothetical protein [Pirellulales bacterium]
MDLTISAAGLSFALCGIIAALGSLLIWAIRTMDRWIQRPADRWTGP